MIRVLLADDHGLFREGLRRLLETVSDDIQICGMAADGSEVLALIEQEQPDLVLVDMQMPGMDGVEVVRVVRPLYPDLPVAVLTTYDDRELIVAAMQAGASGYLLKEMSGMDLAEAVRKLYAGKYYVDPDAAARLIINLKETPKDEELLVPRKKQDIKNTLSSKEIQIIRMLAQGKGNREMALVLHVSEGTIKNYVSRLYGKLGVADRAQAVAYAFTNQLI